MVTLDLLLPALLLFGASGAMMAVSFLKTGARWKPALSILAAVLLFMLVYAIDFIPEGGDYPLYVREGGRISVAQVLSSAHLAWFGVQELGRALGSYANGFATVVGLGSTLFVASTAAMLATDRFSPRACRQAALLLATPMAFMFFGWREFGYLYAAVWPLAAKLFMARLPANSDRLAYNYPYLIASAALFGFGAALHALGMFALLGGLTVLALDSIRARRIAYQAIATFGGVFLGFYMGWVLIYMVRGNLLIPLHLYGTTYRALANSYFDDSQARAVYAILSGTGLREITSGLLVGGVFAVVSLVSVRGLRATLRSHDTQTFLAFVLPAVVQYPLYWPVLGLVPELDLVQAVTFPMVWGIIIGASASPGRSVVCWVLLLASMAALLALFAAPDFPLWEGRLYVWPSITDRLRDVQASLGFPSPSP